MSGRMFQNVVLQLKENTDRTVGVIDGEGVVIACSELSMIGQRWAEYVPVVNSANGGMISSDGKTFKALTGWGNQFDYAVFAFGDNEVSRTVCAMATVALNAAKAGAAHVCAVDISQEAVDMARKNAELNNLQENMSFVKANVFDLLTQMAETGKKEYDFIILDPPAFTKSHSTVRNAARGYKEINLKAMKLLPRGGYLATCSCSHFMTDEL